jgi:cyclase
MLLKRVIPSLLYSDSGLYKTVKFGKKKYLGDVINSVRLFNDLGADELILLDIDATRENTGPNLEVVSSLAPECFMPLTYGGGISSVEDAEALLRLGVEKICLNSAVIDHPNLINRLAERFGSSTIVVSIDVKRNIFGKMKVFSFSDNSSLNIDLVGHVKNIALRGAGEILITDVDKEGTQTGFDINLISKVSDAVSIPVIANGGCGNFLDIVDAFAAGASAVSCGSKFVYNGPHNAVLINYLSDEEYRQLNPI